MPIDFGRHSVNQNQRFNEVKVKIRRHFFGVYSTWKRVLSSATDHVELVESGQFEFYEMIQTGQVDSFKFVFINFDGGLKDSEAEFWCFFSKLYLIDHDEYFPEIHFIFVVIAEKFLINLTGDLS